MGAKQFVGGAIIGAGMVYYLDPERGAERRAQLTSTLGLVGGGGRYGMRLGDIGGLEGANLPPRPPDGHRAARIAGGALLAYGLMRRGRLGKVMRTAGVGLIARGLQGLPTSTPPGDRRRTIDIQKTIHVAAPIDQVYAFWSDYGNLPLILSNLREVRDLGAGRSRWVVAGPGNLSVSWDAMLTAREPPRLLAWRSEPGAILENAGVVRFSPEGDGTRIDFRFCYSPPGGRAGRSLAEFFGADPRARVNDNLGRLKTLLEAEAHSPPAGEKV
ncbi:MAG TPA: SRPBCC family protein [Gemmatimonadales bacterium]|nr:SRPBCC family protein [Gemmatimonadales bacterium]